MKNYLLLILILISFCAKSQNTLQVFPNPFTDSAFIQFTIVQRDTATLLVYDLSGRQIKTILHDTILPAGSYAETLSGIGLPDGVYFIKLIYNTSGEITKKVIKARGASGITTETKNSHITLYPNPTRDILNIPIDGIKKITLTNLNGQIIQTSKTEKTTISLASLPAGAYLVSIYDINDVLIKSQQIVKQ